MPKSLPHQLPGVPGDRDLISHKIVQRDRKFVTIFEYPKCTREFDGANWKEIPKCQ